MQLATEANLVTCSGAPQGGESVSDAARSVLVLGTTAPEAKSLGNPEWTADLEYVWRTRTERERLRLHDRAKEMRRRARDVLRMEREYKRQDVLLPVMRVQALRSAEWADDRARAVSMERADVIASCGERWRSIACGCTRHDVRVGCDQPQLCASCRKKHAAKWWRRIARGMDNALRKERARFYATPAYRRRGMLPGIYLITLTAPHTGDIERDRESIGGAVRKLLKHAAKHEWWSTYALTWEVTCGPTERAPDRAKDSAHVHVHLAVIASWIPYTSEQADAHNPGRFAPRRKGERRARVRGLHEVWQQAIPGALQPDVSPPDRTRNEAQSAGYYLAKYVTKGVDASAFTGAKAGELLVAFRGKRKVSTSAHFWDDPDTRCSCCGEAYRMTEAPCSLQDIAPDSVLRAHVVRYKHRRWEQDSMFAPWELRAPERAHEPKRERPDKRNGATRWRLPDRIG